MKAALLARPRVWALCLGLATLLAGRSMPAQQMVTETRDPAQAQDEDFAKSVAEWTTAPYYMSPLVDHLPIVKGIPSPKDVLGYHVGAPATLPQLRPGGPARAATRLRMRVGRHEARP